MGPLVATLIRTVGAPLAFALIAKIGGNALSNTLGKQVTTKVPGPGGKMIKVKQFQPNMLGKLAGGIGNFASGALNLAQGVAGTGLDLAGRGIQAGGIGAGALLAAAGQAPGAVANMGSTEASRAVYGDTPTAAAAKLAAPLGAAAGTAVSALTGAAGTGLQDIGHTLKLGALNRAMAQRVNQYGMQLHGKYNPAELRLIEQMIRTQGHL